MSQAAPVLNAASSESHHKDRPAASSTAAVAAVPPAADSSSSSSTTTAAGGGSGDSFEGGVYTGPARATASRMIIKLTTNLMNTYNAINEKYYANKRKRLLEQQALAMKNLRNEGFDDHDYNYIVQSHELFANRYVVDHSIGKGSFGRVVKAFDTITKKYVAIKIVKCFSPDTRLMQPNGQHIRAEEVKTGMTLINQHGQPTIVTAVDRGYDIDESGRRVPRSDYASMDMYQFDLIESNSNSPSDVHRSHPPLVVTGNHTMLLICHRAARLSRSDPLTVRFWSLRPRDEPAPGSLSRWAGGPYWSRRTFSTCTAANRFLADLHSLGPYRWSPLAAEYNAWLMHGQPGYPGHHHADTTKSHFTDLDARIEFQMYQPSAITLHAGDNQIPRCVPIQFAHPGFMRSHLNQLLWSNSPLTAGRDLLHRSLCLQSAWLVGMWLSVGSVDSRLLTRPECEVDIERVQQIIADSIDTTPHNEHLNGDSWLHCLLDRLNMLHDQRLPSSLLTDDVDVRRHLLAGFIDGIGVRITSEDGYEINMPYQQHTLADQIKHLARGIGLTIVNLTPSKSCIAGPIGSIRFLVTGCVPEWIPVLTAHKQITRAAEPASCSWTCQPDINRDPAVAPQVTQLHNSNEYVSITVKGGQLLTQEGMVLHNSKTAFYKQAQIELKILMSLQHDADKWNIVNVVDQFIHKNHQCIVFELLSLNLYELLKNTRFIGVSLKLIAKFGQQLLCISEGMSVTMADGSAKRIEDVQSGDLVLGVAATQPAGQIDTFTQRRVQALLRRGTKECVELRFADGRTLTCTSDHRILTSDGKWVEAGKLRVGVSRVCAGSEGVLTHIDTDARSDAGRWCLDLTRTLGLTLDLQSGPSRARSFAFARLAGLLIDSQQRRQISCQNHIDRHAIENDLRTIGVTVESGRQTTEGYSIPIPHQLRSAIQAIQPTDSSSIIPPAFTHPSCPLSLVVEFLGALFGRFPSSFSVGRFLMSPPASFAGDLLIVTQLLHRTRLDRAAIRIDQDTCTIHIHQHKQFAQVVGMRYAAAKQLQLTQLASQRAVKEATVKGAALTHPLPNASTTGRLPSSASSFGVVPSTLPLFSVLLVDRRSVGSRRVYDLVVPSESADTDSFLVAGLAVHNCTLGYLGSKERGDKRIIHCDLKPENILLRNCKSSGLKVIDFGSACFANQKTYTYIQSRFYRAPEILLGLPYNGAIDMWSLGAILVEMHSGKPLFDGQDEVDQMVKQVELLGVPPRHMLERNRKAEKFFELSESTGQYRLKRQFGPFDTHASLKRSLGFRYEDTPLYHAFEDLIMSMLVFDPLERIRPSQALQHPFFTAIASVIAGDHAAAAAAAAAKAQPAQDVNMAASPQAATAMDTSSPGVAQPAQPQPDTGAQQKFALMHQQQSMHSHSRGRSGSRKRPHSNPVFGASSAAAYHNAPLVPLDTQVQAILANQAAQTKQQTAIQQPQRNNLMADEQKPTNENNNAKPTDPAASASSSSSSVLMDDHQPDAASTSIVPPVTPSKHGMVTRSGGSSKKDPPPSLDAARVAPVLAAGGVASGGSSADSSGRSTPQAATLTSVDPTMADVPNDTQPDANCDSSKSASDGKRKGKRNKSKHPGVAVGSSNPNGSEGEEANQMSRMSLDLDQAASAAAGATSTATATSGPRTRSHAAQTPNQ